mmetsp:Transcript_29989/g.29512  ORF Transcript_29989/g.29512 Transcript_29989/m.29512 type:complete len:212 (+) Transcript_29989:153-788(+)
MVSISSLGCSSSSTIRFFSAISSLKSMMRFLLCSISYSRSPTSLLFCSISFLRNSISCLAMAICSEFFWITKFKSNNFLTCSVSSSLMPFFSSKEARYFLLSSSNWSLCLLIFSSRPLPSSATSLSRALFWDLRSSSSLFLLFNSVVRSLILLATSSPSPLPMELEASLEVLETLSFHSLFNVPSSSLSFLVLLSDSVITLLNSSILRWYP